jgi:diguanylate cyclase (GGDEF)-like protein/PAS domain S-box-containing protein
MVREANERNTSLLDSSRDAIAYVHEGAFVYVNSAYLEMFGYQESGQLEGLPLMNLVTRADRSKIKKLLRDFTRGKRDCDRVETTGLCADGSEFGIWLLLQPASVQGEPCVQVQFQKAVTASELELTELHQRDMLTGLYNRHYFMSKLEEKHNQITGGDGTAAMFYILLDRYRQTCEEYGLTTGEGLVKEIAEVARQTSPVDQVLARFSECAIAVLCQDQTEEAMLAQAKLLRTKIEDHVLQSDSRMVTTTCCIGICMIDARLENADAIISAADKACDRARVNSSDRIELYRPSSADTGNDGKDDVATVRAAMDEGRLALLFQPIASLKDAGEERYTLRAMVSKEDGEYEEPGNGVTQSADLDVAMELDAWTLTRAYELLAENKSQDRKVVLFLPVTASTVTNPQRLCDLANQVPAGASLVVQIDESLAEKFYRQSLELARRIHKLESKITLSEFNVSKNALRLISLLQPDYVKFSAELVSGMSGNSDSRAFVDDISERMRAAGGETVAVDITTAQQLASIWQTPMTLIQGDFVAQPSETMEFDFEQFVA